MSRTTFEILEIIDILSHSTHRHNYRGGCVVPGLHVHNVVSTSTNISLQYTTHTHQDSHSPALQSCLLCTRWLLLRLDLELFSCGHRQSECVFGTYSFWNGLQKRSCARTSHEMSMTSQMINSTRCTIMTDLATFQ